jgi:hypothetical protein
MRSSPDFRLQLGCVWGGIVLLAVVFLAVPTPEPVYQGKKLSEWLFVPASDFGIMPNDIYGHIHDELWEAVVAGGYEARDHETPGLAFTRGAQVPDPSAEAVRAIGTNAIPFLLELLSPRPSLAERAGDILRLHLPPFVARVLGNDSSFETVARRRNAARYGFQALGTNAACALPVLTQRLHGPEADFELGLIIGDSGPRGREVLLTALTESNKDARRIAAFCLGVDPSAREAAVPVLLSLLERDESDSQVMGAIGRLGGPPELVIPAIAGFLQKTNALTAGGGDSYMAILVLGLYREKARNTASLLAQLYPEEDTATRQAIRMVLKRICPERVEELLHRPPSESDDEDPGWNGAKE